MLRVHAREAAGADARDGADHEHALAKRMKAIEPQIVKLRARLAKVLKTGEPRQGGPTGRPSRPVGTPSKGTKSGGTDFLDEIGAL